MKLIALATAAVVVASSSSAATLIDFETDGTGPQVNGFMSDDSAIASFTDSSGADLRLDDFAAQGDGNSLGIFGDDISELIVSFSQDVTDFQLDFGNDDSGFFGSPVFATLMGYLGGSLVGDLTVAANGDDIMNQSIGLGGTVIDEAVFFYSDAGGTAINLIEIVDNLSFAEVAAVPVPASLPLLLLGAGALFGVSRRRK